ncbi:MAG: DNA/RNA non-specific endonuclease [Okeania sp. SIO3I5]|uniref:DNA/RNA non-specific endonuclease n=1 Tax=Okeania sp. SIO3I5 TaxID=2607805 RepID=UPI0013BDF3EE|nr:DNA/RNA non-specific endonuclease [Okeania sp. SIO3I5]NEQ34963.1 DNA/RNA non-specific endonuclease [Okeania sp. SIO3I5]
MLRLSRKIALGITILLLTLTSGCSLLLKPSPKVHITLGNPSNATTSIENSDNYLMEKPQYVLSYNRNKGTANWVSWQLNKSWLGNVERQDDFRPDETLPEDWYHVRPSNYRNSGYDRGHLIPSADRTANEKDNSATFLMTNIIPQSPDNNRETWRELEQYSRELVEAGNELYIIAGGYRKKGNIADGKVTIPSRTWKIIVVLKPGSGVRGVNKNTRVIAVDMPNSNRIRSDWKAYRVSVDKIESATGYDFLSKVPKEIQDAIESRVDNG